MSGLLCTMHCLCCAIPTDEEKTFCSISSAHGVELSLSSRVPSLKMPKAWGGKGMGQLHCLPEPQLNLTVLCLFSGAAGFLFRSLEASVRNFCSLVAVAAYDRCIHSTPTLTWGKANVMRVSCMTSSHRQGQVVCMLAVLYLERLRDG